MTKAVEGSASIQPGKSEPKSKTPTPVVTTNHSTGSGNSSNTNQPHLSTISYSGINYGTKTVSDGATSQTVTYVSVNPKDSQIVMQPVVADNHIGSTASLANLAESVHGVAAINGTFFNSGTDNVPDAVIMLDGQFENIRRPAMLLIGKDNSLQMGNFEQQTMITMPSRSLAVWEINDVSPDPNSVNILTPLWGKTTGKNLPTVQVEGNKVTAIHTGSTAIPSNGYDIVFGDSKSNQDTVQSLSVGETVSYHTSLINMTTHAPVDTSNLESAIGSGPMLVDEGKIVLDPAADDITASYLIDEVTERSFIGIDKQGNFIMATVHSANLAQEAKIASNFGLVEAMNLDGGPSTGLYYDGKYLVTPCGELSNALVVSVK